MVSKAQHLIVFHHLSKKRTSANVATSSQTKNEWPSLFRGLGYAALLTLKNLAGFDFSDITAFLRKSGTT